MASKRSFKRLGIFGHVGTKNLGDEAIITAVIQQVRERYPDAELIAFTGNPEDTQKRHGLRSFPIRRWKHVGDSSGVSSRSKFSRFAESIRAAVKKAPRLSALLKGLQQSVLFVGSIFAELRFLAESRRHLKSLDVLIFAGSNQLNDYVEGPWAFPYTLLKWCLLAKWARAKIVFLCCGAGPLQSRLGRLFIKYSLSLGDYRSYRDEVSRKLVEAIGVPGDHLVCTDLAYGLRPPRRTQPESPRSRLIVGVNPVPFF